MCNILCTSKLLLKKYFFRFYLAALHSVFKTSELETFTGLSRKDKESQLMEFTRIVTGIRLFNKDCQKGGEGIDDRK